MGGALFSALFAFPFFMLTNTLNPTLISLAFILIMGIGGGAMFGPQAAFFAELFGPRLRYSGFAFARELGSILAGGPSPFIAALLVGYMAGAPWGVACYVILLSLLTALAVWWGPETKHQRHRRRHAGGRRGGAAAAGAAGVGWRRLALQRRPASFDTLRLLRMRRFSLWHLPCPSS